MSSETCEKVERSVEEIITIGKMPEGTLSSEEKVFLRNSLKAVEECLQRKAKVTIE